MIQQSSTRLVPAVGYVRMSTDRQEDSPARQRKDIETLAQRQGYKILAWYEDHGLTGTDSANRPEFLRLLNDAQKGKFAAVLTSEQSRMSREDIFDAMMHWRLFRDAGVRIVTCQRGELNLDNLGGVIMAIVDQYGAREESAKLADRTVSGLRLRIKSGQRIGGKVFGYDREMIDEKGNVVKTIHFGDNFHKPSSWTSRIVPSQDTESVEAVRWAFDAICRGESIASVAREFRRRGLRSIYGNLFTATTVTGMLNNPTYAGALRVGKKKTRAKFVPLVDEMVVVEDAHEPIISMETFERVQEILKSRKGTPPTQRQSLYLLGGLVFCGHCGIRAHAKYVKGRFRRSDHYYYQCYERRRPENAKPCGSFPIIPGDILEQAVLDTIRSELLTEKAAPRLRDAIIRATRTDKKQITREERKLIELRRKIERGTENLALANEEDFAGIANLLAKWREEEAQLTLEISRHSENLKAVPEALEVLSNMDLIRDNLDEANWQTLRIALLQTIERIEIRKDYEQIGELSVKKLTAEIIFRPMVLDGKRIILPSDLFVPKRTWQKVGDYARKRKTPFHLRDVREHFGMADDSIAYYHVKKASQAGLVRRLPGITSGWIGTD